MKDELVGKTLDTFEKYYANITWDEYGIPKETRRIYPSQEESVATRLLVQYLRNRVPDNMYGDIVSEVVQNLSKGFKRLPDIEDVASAYKKIQAHRNGNPPEWLGLPDPGLSDEEFAKLGDAFTELRSKLAQKMTVEKAAQGE